MGVVGHLCPLLKKKKNSSPFISRKLGLGDEGLGIQVPIVPVPWGKGFLFFPLSFHKYSGSGSKILSCAKYWLASAFYLSQWAWSFPLSMKLSTSRDQLAAPCTPGLRLPHQSRVSQRQEICGSPEIQPKMTQLVTRTEPSYEAEVDTVCSSLLWSSHFPQLCPGLLSPPQGPALIRELTTNLSSVFMVYDLVMYMELWPTSSFSLCVHETGWMSFQQRWRQYSVSE